MALTIRHNFVSPIADQGDPTLLGPDEWNDSHAITGESSVDYYTTNGATYPQYAFPTYPAACYSSTYDKTFVVWESYVAAARNVYIRSYDHSSSLPYPDISPFRWSDPVFVAANPLTSDSHGVPSVCVDADGYVHIFHGPHITAPFLHEVTVNPGIITSWQAQTTVGALPTYPAPIIVGSAIWLLTRESHTQLQLSYYKTTALVAGVATWAAEKVIIDFGASSRCYFANPVLRSGKIHFVAMYANVGDTLRQNVYYCVLDTATGDLSNVDGSHTVASASLPISKATADSFYLAASQPTAALPGRGSTLSLSFDATVPHILFADHPTGTTGNIYHFAYYSGAWTTPAIIATIPNISSDWVILENVSGGMDAYGPTGGSETVGGTSIVVMSRSSGASGTWGSQTTVQTADVAAVNMGGAVFAPHANFRALFIENLQADTDSTVGNGHLRLWGYGDSGYVQSFQVGTTGAPGYAPALPGSASVFLNGLGAFSAPTSASGAAAPHYAVQYNDPLGTFAGDADLTWTPGTGLNSLAYAVPTTKVGSFSAGGIIGGSYGVFQFQYDAVAVDGFQIVTTNGVTGNWVFGDGAGSDVKGPFGGGVPRNFAFYSINGTAGFGYDVGLRTFYVAGGNIAQKLQIYNTYSTSTNYEAFQLDWRTTSDVARLSTVAGGTGTVRLIAIDGFQKAGAAAAGDIPSGTFALVHDTSGATFKLCYNDSGTLKTVALT